MSARLFILTLAALSNVAVLASALAAADSSAPSSAAVVTAPLHQAAGAPAVAYSQENLVNDLTEQLTERYRVNGELQIELIRPWAPQRPSAEPVSLTLVEAPGTLSSTLLVRFRLQAGTQILTETSVLVRAQLMRDVWVTRGPVERATPFDPAQFDIRRMDTLREHDVVTTADTSGELTLARSVPAGRLLTWHDLSRKALVRKGQVIEVCAIDGALTVTMKALAMENGTAGETVRLRNLESKKEFTALVVSDSRAEVRL